MLRNSLAFVDKKTRINTDKMLIKMRIFTQDNTILIVDAFSMRRVLVGFYNHMLFILH